MQRDTIQGRGRDCHHGPQQLTHDVDAIPVDVEPDEVRVQHLVDLVDLVDLGAAVLDDLKDTHVVDDHGFGAADE